MKNSMVCSIISWKIAIKHRWNVPGALQSPKGMRLYAKVLYGQAHYKVQKACACMRKFYTGSLLRGEFYETKLRVDTLYVDELPSDCLFLGFENL
nr:hypothetical protein [Tanacetum cinerariifolium]